MSWPEWFGASGGRAAVPAITAGLGVLLLVFGRRLFWLAVAALGFGLGMALAHAVLGDRGAAAWITGLVLGLAGALLAVFVQRMAVILAGGLLGALAATLLLERYGAVATGVEAGVVVAGAIVGGALALGIFGLALRVVTSAVGAALVTRSLDLVPEWAAVLFAGLWIAGFVAQSGSERAGDRRR